MKTKIVLMGLLIAIIATSAVFAQQPTLDKLTFTPNPRNNPTEYRVSKLNNWITGQVVIPGTYEGKPVQIVEYAFDGCTNITSVVILNGVTTIGYMAFRNCTSLANITFPNSLAIVESRAFELCSSLSSIVIPPSVTRIDSGAFSGALNITSITFQANVNYPDTGVVFPGSGLMTLYKSGSGGAGTYTRPAGSNTWTKTTASQPVPPRPSTASIDGMWRTSGGMVFVITGSAGQSTPNATLSADGRTLTISGVGTFTRQ